MQKQTKAIRIQAERSHNREHSVPLYLTSSFTFDDAEEGRAIFAEEKPGNIYSRYMNPNVDEFVEKMVMLENAEAGLAFSTGMAAIFASMAGLLKAGDHIVASNALFGSCIQILTKITATWGIECTFVPGADLKAWQAAIQPNTKFFFCESPSNPGLELIDLPALAALKNGRDIVLAVDNCFATPILQNPISLGADIVMHATTKYIGGHSDVLGGAIIVREENDRSERLKRVQILMGATQSPLDCYLLARGLKTLPLRMREHSASALALAQRLEKHIAIEKVHYPGLASHPQHALAKRQMPNGFSGMISIQIKGDEANARKVASSLKLFQQATSLGGVESLAEHRKSIEGPDSKTPGNLVRLSIGLEHVDDLWEDLNQALSV
jgi:cystathionine beta-lyase/cystathionine gamma-synthase